MHDVGNISAGVFFHQIVFNLSKYILRENIMAKETAVHFLMMFELLDSDTEETKTRGKTK